MTSLAQTAPAPEAPQALLDEATAEIGKVVVGHRGPIELLLTAAVAGGHVLLEGPPGVAKTLLAGSLARALGVQFSRIQLTPDTRPSELTGETVVKFGERTFAPGAVFTNVLLADEINRAQPRAQAALLEAMQEHHVTIDGRSHWLPVPFVVIATQNPFEHEGVFRLPASQLDRFLFRVAIDYPTEADELEMLAIPHRGVTPDMLEDIRPLLDVARLLRLQGLVDGVVVPGGRLALPRRDRAPDARAPRGDTRREPARDRPPAGRGAGERRPRRPARRRTRGRRADGAARPRPPGHLRAPRRRRGDRGGDRRRATTLVPGRMTPAERTEPRRASPGRTTAVAAVFAATVVAATVSWVQVVTHLRNVMPLETRGTPAAIVWSDRVFRSEAEFARWLRGRGISYERWVRTHPKAVAILRKRDRAATPARAAAPATEPGPGTCRPRRRPRARSSPARGRPWRSPRC